MRSIKIKNTEVLVAAGSSYNKLKSKISTPHIHIKKFVPQLNVLKNSDIFITRGGKNSINEALKFGVPMLLFPAGGEQVYNANLVEYLNAGINFSDKMKSFTTAEMTSALTTLLTSPVIQSSLKKLSDLHMRDDADVAYEKIILYASRLESNK